MSWRFQYSSSSQVAGALRRHDQPVAGPLRDRRERLGRHVVGRGRRRILVVGVGEPRERRRLDREECPAATAGRGSSRRSLPRRPGWPTPGRTRGCSRPATRRPGRRGWPPRRPEHGVRRISDSSVFSWISPRHQDMARPGGSPGVVWLTSSVAARDRDGPSTEGLGITGRAAREGRGRPPPPCGSAPPALRLVPDPPVASRLRDRTGRSVSASYIGPAGWIG